MPQIREAQTQDVKFLLQGVEQIQILEKDNKTDLKLSTNFNQEIEKWLLDLIEMPAGLVIILNVSGEDCGFIIGLVEPQHNNFSDYSMHGIIQALFIKDEYRRKKMGSLLVNELISSFKEHQIQYCDISYHPQNQIAKQFWSQLGFIDAQIIARKML